MTKKIIKHAAADVGLIFSAYNLRQIFNLTDHNLLKQYLKVVALYFGVLIPVFKAFTDCFVLRMKNTVFQKEF